MDQAGRERCHRPGAGRRLVGGAHRPRARAARLVPGRYYGDGPVEFSHSLTEQIGGQLAAGFTLTHLVEAPHHLDPTARYMPGYIATRAATPG